MGIDGLTETINRYSHVAHEERIMQTVQRRTYIRSCFRSRSDASIRENTSGYRTDFQLGTETFCRRLFFRRPFFYVPINIQWSIINYQFVFVRFFPLRKDFAEMPQFLDG